KVLPALEKRALGISSPGKSNTEPLHRCDTGKTFSSTEAPWIIRDQGPIIVAVLYGVLSDIHSNLEALEAVLGLFADFGVGGYICCGDLVGYGPDPEPCLQRLRELKNLSIICGNHDLAVLGRIEPEWFNPYARAAVLWTRDHISEESRRFLEGLTAKLEQKEFTIAHG